MKMGRFAYTAYTNRAGGKTFDGKPLPTWEELGDERQSCWDAAALGVVEEIRKNIVLSED